MASENELDLVLLKTAELFASLSNCKRLKVGAVIAKEGRILSSGFNGTPVGFENTCEHDNVTVPQVIHAELNAILFLAKNGVSGDNSSMYVTHSPCPQCCNSIVQTGIKRVVFKEYFRDTSGLEMLNDLGVRTLNLGN